LTNPSKKTEPAAPETKTEISLVALAARVDEIETVLKRAGLVHEAEAIELDAQEEAQV
jgi:hypothetical protein